VDAASRREYQSSFVAKGSMMKGVPMKHTSDCRQQKMISESTQNDKGWAITKSHYFMVAHRGQWWHSFSLLKKTSIMVRHRECHFQNVAKAMQVREQFQWPTLTSSNGQMLGCTKNGASGTMKVWWHHTIMECTCLHSSHLFFQKSALIFCFWRCWHTWWLLWWSKVHDERSPSSHL
jgi:hypothetical protein